MTVERFYPVGTPGQPWTQTDKREWFGQQSIQRSYQEDVLAKLERLGPKITVERYGALPIDLERYPLFAATSQAAGSGAPWVLITGGVHGYETSGVQGALAFLEDHVAEYTARVNLIVAPCVSPWGYEVIHRWNPDAIDPNRSFSPESPSQESACLMRLVGGASKEFLCHIDLHETTDSDVDEFRPALAARDGKPLEPGSVPDGFYTVGDTENPQPEFQSSIIAGVSEVTHIAPADENGEIIGEKVTQPGVILYPFAALGLCGGVTSARFTTTTEVYPDSPKSTPEICNRAQVAAIRAGLDHALDWVGSAR